MRLSKFFLAIAASLMLFGACTSAPDTKQLTDQAISQVMEEFQNVGISAAVVKDGREVLSNIVSSQIDIHKLYGGVVPEIASRNHVMNIDGALDEALKQANLTLEMDLNLYFQLSHHKFDCSGQIMRLRYR